MVRGFFARVLLFSALCTLHATGAAAQAVYGSLVGNVTDTSGGAIPGAPRLRSALAITDTVH